MGRLSFILVLLSLTIIPGNAAAGLFGQSSPLIEARLKGEIDWEKGLIRATGTAAAIPDRDDKPSNISVKRLGEIRAAKIDAMRNLLELIKTIRVDSSSKVESYMIASDYVRNSMHDIVRKAQIVEKKYLSNGGVRLIIELSMTGPFLEALVADTGGLTMSASGINDRTGMVIDATGLGARPALSPRVLDENGREMYGASYIKRDFFLSKGIVAYRSDLEKAINSARVADNPIRIRALRSSGHGKSDLIISGADAKMLRQDSSSANWLEEGNVIIVID